MNILIACEFSGIVRNAFTQRGHRAVSCDLLDAELPGEHIKGDIRRAIDAERWDMMIAFPPCTHLCSSVARWWKAKRDKQRAAIEFVLMLASCPIPRIAIENPVGVLSTAWRRHDQIIQPWQFGHGETKATCLWLRNLPSLTPTNIVDGREARVHRTPPSPNRWKERSRTLPGVASAMAEQWI